MGALLKIEDLHVYILSSLPITHVVRGISYSLEKGESLGIIGESGCGKSLASKAILNLLLPKSFSTGKIVYKGRDIKNCSNREMEELRSQEIAFTPQDAMNALNPTMTIGDQIIESFRKKNALAPLVEVKQAIHKILMGLEFLNIPLLLEAYPHMLSGGMCQRVLIALALIRMPQLLIADEPTTGLDRNLKINVLNFMKAHQQERGMGLILISHDLSTIAQFCNKVIVMYAGKIVESASTTQLFNNPQHPYTQGLIKSSMHFKLDKTQPLSTIRGQPPSLERSLEHCAFCERCDVAMNICGGSIPPLYPIDTFHQSACFKHDKRNIS